MSQRSFWAIVLAGGEGSRLASLARQVYGSGLPKQFLGFGRKRTLLQSTLDRLEGLIPSCQTVVVVAQAHEALARQQLSEFREVELVAQPRNAGTAPGVLLPLLHVLQRDPQSDVVIVPSDHDFRAPAVMLRAVVKARAATTDAASSLVLLGAEAEAPATDLGWIVTEPGRGDTTVRVERFVEKPPPELARELFRQGALWNTMLTVARADSLWELARCHLPEHASRFESYAMAAGASRREAALLHVYERLCSADFSRDLVEPAQGLRAAPLVGSGWSDCGTPERLAAALARSEGPSMASAAPAFMASS